jgi:hypothetical protein
MGSLTELPEDELKEALDALDTLMKFKRCLPRPVPGRGLLVMLVSRFRDDVREALGMEPERYSGRGEEIDSLDELTSAELDSLAGAVATLLEERFANLMDDPELPRKLREFDSGLAAQKQERAQLRAEIDVKAAVAS